MGSAAGSLAQRSLRRQAEEGPQVVEMERKNVIILFRDFNKCQNVAAQRLSRPEPRIPAQFPHVPVAVSGDRGGTLNIAAPHRSGNCREAVQGKGGLPRGEWPPRQRTPRSMTGSCWGRGSGPGKGSLMCPRILSFVLEFLQDDRGGDRDEPSEPKGVAWRERPYGGEVPVGNLKRQKLGL